MTVESRDEAGEVTGIGIVGILAAAVLVVMLAAVVLPWLGV